MKLLIILGLLFSSMGVQASLQDAVNDCYLRGQTLEQSSRCADLRLARAIEGQNPLPTPRTHSIIYGCTSDFNPSLVKKIIDNSGKAVRRTIINTYTTGGQSARSEACRNDAFKNNYVIADVMKTECNCSGDFNPIMKMNLLDRNYREVETIDISTFYKGSERLRRQQCQQAISNLRACHIQ